MPRVKPRTGKYTNQDWSDPIAKLLEWTSRTHHGTSL
jgi:hypothetical protein